MRSLTVYIPLYDAAEYLEKTLRKLEEYFLASKNEKENGDQFTVVFVNDGSRDGTEKILAENQEKMKFRYRIVSLPRNYGKGAALKMAIQEIVPQTEFVAFTDGELPYGLAIFGEALQIAIAENADFVAGERVSKTNQYTKYRRFASRLFRVFLPRKLRDVNDTQCGFKLFRRDRAISIFSHLHTGRWVFDVEIFLVALENNFRIMRVPVSIRPELIQNGRLRFFLNGFQIIWDLLRIRYYDRKGNYKIL